MGSKISEEEPRTSVRDNHGQEDGEHQEAHDHGSKGRRFRVSGGFLLRNSILSSRTNDDRIKPIKPDVEVGRGKQRAENGDIRVLKQRGAHQSSKPFVGSSPLLPEATQGQNTGNCVQAGPDQDKRHSKLSTAGESWRSAGSGNLSSTGSGPSQQSEGGNLWRNSLGQETDPKQLVNLALNLSESRRRNASGALVRAPRDVSGGLRIISSGQRSNGSPHGVVSGSLRQYLREPHRSPSNVSSRSGNSNRSRNNRPETFKSHAEKDRVVPQTTTDTVALNSDELFKVSDATLARAEKARVALELGYEYRRLLQYLPIIPKPQQNKKPSSRGKMYSAGGSTPELGREYNPLQYIRNRRIRLREKKPLNPDLDGWKDIDRVRAWIDAVKNDREFGISRVNDRFPLPSFDALGDLPIVVEGPGSSTVTEHTDAQGQPSRRPTSDWVFASSDLLADVYWLDQDRNLDRIEDSQARKIKPYLEDAKHVLSRKSKELSRQRDDHSSTSVNKDHVHRDIVEHEAGGVPHGHSERSHQSKAQRDKMPGETEDSVRMHRSRWSKKLLRSRSLSSGSESDWSRKNHSFSNYEETYNTILEKQMMQMIAAETQDEDSNTDDLSRKDDSVRSGSRVSRFLHHESRSLRSRPDNLHRMKTDNPILDRRTKPPHASFEDERIRHRRLSSHDYQAPPKSPIPSLAPSITIDSSPPKSPQSSTVSPVKRPFINRLGSFRRDRSRSIGRRAASDIEAKDYISSAPVSRQITNESSSNNLGDRSIYSNGALLSPTKGDQPMNKGPDARPVRHSREANMSESRLRGMFRGGRIAELVGTEMSRVGDRLLGRESSTSLSQMATDKPTQPSDDSEDDNDNSEHDSKLDRTNTNDSVSLVMANSNGAVKKDPRLSANERPTYHLNNLPSFRSPFVKDDRPRLTPQSDLDDHHITRQQQALKERGRSPKFDRLALPKIDVRDISPSPSRTRSRSQSRSQSRDVGRGRSRGSSNSRSLSGVQVADRRLNDVLGAPGRIATSVRAPTGLAGLSTEAGYQDGQNSHREKKPWSISDHTISALPSTITKRDIARVRALLLSSGIKAYEIARRQEDPPAVPSPMLQGLGDVIKDPLEPVPPSQEFVFAARALIMDIENTNKTLRDAAEAFSAETADGLHDRINKLDAHVNEKLTSLVQGAADDADAFGAELTTTHTLATRELNNSIDDILRIRRHRARWLRRGGWTLVEWLVLGTLWVAWLIAVIIRIIRGTVKGLVAGVRWLLWV